MTQVISSDATDAQPGRAAVYQTAVRNGSGMRVSEFKTSSLAHMSLVQIQSNLNENLGGGVSSLHYNSSNHLIIPVSDFIECQAKGICSEPIDYIISRKKIKDIKAGEEVLTLDEKTGKLVPRKVNALLDHGIKLIHQMATESGKAINTTGEHPYLVTKCAFPPLNTHFYLIVVENLFSLLIF